jgi:hypothetical protein
MSKDKFNFIPILGLKGFNCGLGLGASWALKICEFSDYDFRVFVVLNVWRFPKKGFCIAGGNFRSVLLLILEHKKTSP